ncbi:uncharacterized protein K489DRAFT_398946 [Dissoconium aciculare CBS 342.82]|uniref:Tat pathway signal sequence n=1 Tax=Dissoconium aciculare CBS 342.82 TaxID=1314786 RepID=A0A6J3MFE3_9PEZI|nr:uncharacterized protein K489DRAFT_398946 [Dissoconium aciculare CBS 342.82]KAF1826695.1 hypothetical protein K489DRAFT_398946 [Dissoconium aciculare CBS 342.82]
MERYNDSAAKESRSGHHLLSSTDDQDEPRIIYLPERRSRWSSIASWLSCFFLGVIATLLTLGVAFRQNAIPESLRAAALSTSPSTPSFTFGSTDPLPNVPSETVVFEADPIFSDRSTDDTDFAWDMLLPPGRGYVYVPDGASRGLLPGQYTPEGEIYSVAMYHQLHCLARIRKQHWIFKDGIVTGDTGMARTFAGRGDSSHAQHCFDYLRQSILCSGDMTLEWPKQDGPSSGATVDGWGVPHTCKAPAAIKAYMDANHMNGSSNFDAAG